MLKGSYNVPTRDIDTPQPSTDTLLVCAIKKSHHGNSALQLEINFSRRDFASEFFISRRDFTSEFRFGISVRNLKISKSALLGFHRFNYKQMTSSLSRTFVLYCSQPSKSLEV